MVTTLNQSKSSEQMFVNEASYFFFAFCFSFPFQEFEAHILKLAGAASLLEQGLDLGLEFLDGDHRGEALNRDTLLVDEEAGPVPLDTCSS